MKPILRIAALLLLLPLAACSPKKDANQAQDAQPKSQEQTATQDAAPPTQDTAAGNAAPAAPQPAALVAGMVHDPSNPPIDCPLRKQGLDPTKMKPFEQIEAYIQFLDREDRAIWQKPLEVVDAMQLQGNERVLDLGAGSGYFSFPIAQRLTSGRLFAADVEPEMIRHIHHNAMLKGVQNIEVRIIDPQAPQIPENIDVVFMCDVMHHIANPVEWMSGIAKQLPDGAQFHIIEFKQGDIPDGPPEQAKIAPEKLVETAQAAGFQLARRVDGLLPYQYYYVFEKTAAQPHT